MNKRIIHRSWFYFRTGWSVYFAFILGAVNTLTVTYYLAIEKAPALKEIFPTFVTYVIVAALVVLPILTLVGYLHIRRSNFYREESNISVESNPHIVRLIQTSEVAISVNVEILELLTKLSHNEKLTDEETNRILKIKEDLKDHISKKLLK